MPDVRPLTIAALRRRRMRNAMSAIAAVPSTNSCTHALCHFSSLGGGDPHVIGIDSADGGQDVRMHGSAARRAKRNRSGDFWVELDQERAFERGASAQAPATVPRRGP